MKVFILHKCSGGPCAPHRILAASWPRWDSISLVAALWRREWGWEGWDPRGCKSWNCPHRAPWGFLALPHSRALGRAWFGMPQNPTAPSIQPWMKRGPRCSGSFKHYFYMKDENMDKPNCF